MFRLSIIESKVKNDAYPDRRLDETQRGMGQNEKRSQKKIEI